MTAQQAARALSVRLRTRVFTVDRGRGLLHSLRVGEIAPEALSVTDTRGVELWRCDNVPQPGQVFRLNLSYPGGIKVRTVGPADVVANLEH